LKTQNKAATKPSKEIPSIELKKDGVTIYGSTGVRSIS
jgi:hypothetical protein